MPSGVDCIIVTVDVQLRRHLWKAIGFNVTSESWSIIAYGSEDEAVTIANDSPYGLSGGVWSADAERAKGVARRIRTGQIEVNGGAFNPNAAFGGYKQSGYGREYGEHGFDEFLETKSMQL